MSDMEKENQLVTIETVTALEVFGGGKMNPLLEEIESEVRSRVADVSTAKGRGEIASLANKVAKSKVHLDNLGKNLNAERNALNKAVDIERKAMRERLDALKVEARKPLTDWEEAMEARKLKIDTQLAVIEGIAEMTEGDDSARLAAKIVSIDELSLDPELYGDRISEADGVKERARNVLIAKMEVAKKQEADAIELQKLREEKEKRDAEEAQREANRKARADAIVRAAEEKAIKEERERVEKEQAEKDRLAEIQRKKDEEVRIEQAKKRAAQDAIAKLKSEQAAKLAEVNRLAEIEAAKKLKAENEELKRKSDENHRQLVREQASKALSNVEDYRGNKPDFSRIVEAIERGIIPHVTINF